MINYSGLIDSTLQGLCSHRITVDLPFCMWMVYMIEINTAPCQVAHVRMTVHGGSRAIEEGLLLIILRYWEMFDSRNRTCTTRVWSEGKINITIRLEPPKPPPVISRGKRRCGGHNLVGADSKKGSSYTPKETLDGALSWYYRPLNLTTHPTAVGRGCTFCLLRQYSSTG